MGHAALCSNWNDLPKLMWWKMLDCPFILNWFTDSPLVYHPNDTNECLSRLQSVKDENKWMEPQVAKSLRQMFGFWDANFTLGDHVLSFFLEKKLSDVIFTFTLFAQLPLKLLLKQNWMLHQFQWNIASSMHNIHPHAVFGSSLCDLDLQCCVLHYDLTLMALMVNSFHAVLHQGIKSLTCLHLKQLGFHLHPLSIAQKGFGIVSIPDCGRSCHGSTEWFQVLPSLHGQWPLLMLLTLLASFWFTEDDWLKSCSWASHWGLWHFAVSHGEL